MENMDSFRQRCEALERRTQRVERRLPGLSGLNLQRELSEAEIHLPIIFITGHGDLPMTVQAMKAGAVECLTKPFRDQDLLDAIQQALARDRAEHQQRRELKPLHSFYI